MNKFIRSYHILSHKNTEKKLLTTNAFVEVYEKIDDIFFKKEDNSLLAVVNNQYCFIFENLPDDFWDSLLKKNTILVEFGPVSPIAEYEIVLS